MAEQVAFNEQLARTQPEITTHTTIGDWIKEAAAQMMTKRKVTKRPFELSETTEAHMETKRSMIQHGASDTELTDIRKTITKSVRRDRRQYNINRISKEVDIRDQFMGSKQLRKEFTPIPLGMKDKEGRHIPFDRRAQAAAEFLGTVFWGGGAETLPTNTESPTPKPRIVTEDLHMNLNLISMAELIWAVGRLKRRKAAGPDGLPVDCYKEMSKEQLELVLQMLNEWLEGTPTPEELTCAQITLLHKKGD